MSLDVYLRIAGASVIDGTGIFVRENGRTIEITREEWDRRYPDREPVIATCEASDTVYSANITHNLNQMAVEAGLYQYLWRPEEVDMERAEQLIEPLRAGLERLRADPRRFKEFNPSNGWGDYEGLVNFTESYLAACEANPQATVSVWR